MKKISVIVPLYNRAKFIEAALRSLVVQAADCDLDIIVVDDGSTDEGPAIVHGMAERYPFIRMISTENQGVSKARNVGLKQLRPGCEFVTFLDSDDVSTAARLATDLAEFDATPELSLTYGQIMMIDKIDHLTLAPTADSNTAIIRSIHVGAGIFRKSLVDRVGTFDESLPQGEDTDFLLRCFETGDPYRLVETITLYYRQHAGNMSRDKEIVIKFLIHALRRSIVRRRSNPGARIPENLFNMKALEHVYFEFEK
ncbi:glycosyltransferase family 2 protein [Mesorhizobium sp. M0761]|uniref:glycosyltransferase family 2 protein n=1 Tax=Mesorhizobium sp. M0761 TaxID=2956994 RepID=UPI00333BC038